MSADSSTDRVSTHSRPKAAGSSSVRYWRRTLFQHTAARRRLDAVLVLAVNEEVVSTHSRPKAAGWSEISDGHL